MSWSGVRGVIRRLFRRRPTLAPISEVEAYGRSYGERTGDILRVVAVPKPHPEPPEEPAPSGFRDLTGELLRRAFEKRLEARGKRTPTA